MNQEKITHDQTTPAKSDSRTIKSTIDPKVWTNQSLEELRRKQNDFKQRSEPKPTVISKEYENKLYGKKNDTLDEIVDKVCGAVRRKQRKVPQSRVDYEAARYIVWKAIETSLRDKGENFKVDGNTREVLPELTRYFIGDPACKYDLRKGLYLWGNVGRGKTFLVRILKTFVDAIDFKQRQFRIENAINIESQILQTESFKPLAEFSKDVWCFDDAGQERPNAAIFGNHFSTFGELIAMRYNLFIKVGTVTHVTTNVPPQATIDRFGHRLQSRCNEMFNFIKLEGEDKRAQL